MSTDEQLEQEFKVILQAGAMFVVMNVEADYAFEKGVLKHMKEVNEEDFEGKFKTIYYFNYCKMVYAEMGISGMKMLINKELPFPLDAHLK